jgi:hypothetical protein
MLYLARKRDAVCEPLRRNLIALDGEALPPVGWKELNYRKMLQNP